MADERAAPVGEVPPGKDAVAEEYPRVYARVSKPMHDSIESLRGSLVNPVDGTRANKSEVVRQLIVAGHVLLTDRELLAEAVALKSSLGLATMDEAWREILIAGAAALRAKPPPR